MDGFLLDHYLLFSMVGVTNECSTFCLLIFLNLSQSSSNIVEKKTTLKHNVKCNEYPLYRYVLFADNPQIDLTEELARMVGDLVILGRLRYMQSIRTQQMIQTCAKGDITTVQQLIKMKKDLVCVFVLNSLNY